MKYTPAIHYSFRIHTGSEVKTVTEEELGQFAELVGLDRVAPGRLSCLFVMHLYLHLEVYGVDPSMILEEIEALETNQPRIRTKPATQFTREPLKGLWHKHYFSAHFIAHNLSNQLAGGKLKALIERVLDPKKYPTITAEAINEVANEVTSKTLAQRENAGKLTGEWIIFAKHNNVNYYLALSKHDTGDQGIYNQIKNVCFKEFPFLGPEAPQ